jgi:hypothetical protein
VRQWLTAHAGTFIWNHESKGNASVPKKKATRAFYSELPDEVAWFDSLYSLQKARIDEEAEEEQRKAEIWHIFETS